MRKRPTLNELAFFNANKTFRLLKRIPGASKYDVCRVHAPLRIEDNNGFFVKNLCNDDFYIVKTELDDFDRNMIEEHLFPYILWDEFWDYFEDSEYLPATIDGDAKDTSWDRG